MQLTWQSGSSTYDDDSGGIQLRQVPISVLIPNSRLAAFVGDFFVSEPIVSDGDDVYEVNLTPGDRSDRQARPQSADIETEHMFLNFVAGTDADDVHGFIEYAVKNHWFGGKNIFLSLDKSKTILDRQTKLVMHNSKPQNTLDYHMTNASQPIKKTNFILEEWPYVTLNKPLISKGTEDELAPWLRFRNRQLNNRFWRHLQRLNTRPQSVVSMNGNGTLLGNGKQQQTQLHRQYQQQSQYQQHNYQQQQYQQFQYRPQNPQPYPNQIQIQPMSIFYPPPHPPARTPISQRKTLPPLCQHVIIYGPPPPPPRPYWANAGFPPGAGHYNLRYPNQIIWPKRYQLDPNNNHSSPATTNTQK